MNAVPITCFTGAPLPKTTLATVASKFAEVEAMENPDTDVSLASLRATNTGTIEIPNLGEHALNEWSKNQLGAALGISWGKFFNGAGPAEQAEDLNRRLRRARGIVRLRTTTEKPDDTPGEGTIRAVVSPGFTAVKDTAIVGLLADALRGIEPDARVMRSSVTSLSTSFVVKIGEPYRIGGPGNVGEVWGGLLVRNSGVGYSRLVVNLHLVRLSCLNGLCCPVARPAIVRARHSWLDQGQIRTAIISGLDGIGERLRRGTQVLAESTHHGVEDVEVEVRRVLHDGKLPLRLTKPVLAAYSREPHASKFGISQALTLAAQDLSSEGRVLLEALAGRYLAAN